MTALTAGKQPSRLLLLGAFAAIYFIWGSTYLALRFAVETMPPLLMAATRFLAAGLILLAVNRIVGSERPTRRQWLSAGFTGILMMAGGVGVTSWSVQYVASGLVALTVATIPLWMVPMDWLLFRGRRPTSAVLFSLLVGLAGVFLLIGAPDANAARVPLFAAIALLLACLSWSYGSLRSRHAAMPRSSLVTAQIQMMVGGAALLLAGTVLGEWPRVRPEAISLSSLLALGYLILFGSVITLVAYGWLLRVSDVAKVSAYAYVNPVVAIFLGAGFGEKLLTPRVLLASVVILGAVSVISVGRAPKKVAAKESPILPAAECRAGGAESTTG